MNRKTTIFAGLVGVLSLGAVAIAQTISVPTVSSVGTADLLQIIPAGNPRMGNVYVTPALLNSVTGYYKSAPSTGFTFTFGNTQTIAMFRDSTTLSTGSITMPPGPSDGTVACAYSKNIITTLTWAANTGQTLNDAVTTLGAAGHACYVYSLSNATWDRAE